MEYGPNIWKKSRKENWTSNKGQREYFIIWVTAVYANLTNVVKGVAKT